MDTNQYLSQLNEHLSHLYAFARQMNELDFAISLSGEFRGAQDAGWSTTITAHEVYGEITQHAKTKGRRSKAEFRTVLMLYCQLAEAGGVYESLKNVMGVITLKPYLLWPFKDLVQVRGNTRRVIGPNANATFRDLAISARSIGLRALSELLEDTFRDDLRNGVSHADYVIWDDGVRLCKRNGGYAGKLSFDEVNEALTRGIGFYQILTENNGAVIQSYNPPKTIVGRFSANLPMPWTVSYDPNTGAFGISGSSPGSVTTPEYKRQVAINGFLGGKVLALFASSKSKWAEDVENHISAAGFEPNNIELTAEAMGVLVDDISKGSLWDERQLQNGVGEVLLLSPWGFKWMFATSDFDHILSKPVLDFELDTVGGERV